MGDIWVLFAATLAAGFLRGVTGFGFALAAVPIFSLVVTPIHAVVLAQMLQIAAAPVDIVANRRNIDRKSLALLCAGAVLLAPVGAYLATRLPPDVMRVTISAAVFLGLAALLLRVKVPAGRGPAIVAGAIGGLMGGLAGMSGPPAVAYFLGRGIGKDESRATLLLFFAFAAALALTALSIGSDAVTLVAFWGAVVSFPALMLGTWAGTWLFRRLGEGHYRTAALGVLFLSAMLSGIKGLTGLL